MKLDAKSYHEELSPEERALVDAWLFDVFECDSTGSLVVSFEVVAEGRVRFRRIDDNTEDLYVDERNVPTPPPVWR